MYTQLTIDNELKKQLVDTTEEHSRLQMLVETRERKRAKITQLVHENQDFIEIGNCKLCNYNLANVVNFPCHHFGEVCEDCNKKTNFENRCIKCWDLVEFSLTIKYD